MSLSASSNSQTSEDLLTAFRLHYHQFDRAIHDALKGQTDSVVLARLGDDLDEYLTLVNEVSLYVCIFCALRLNMSSMALSLIPQS